MKAAYRILALLLKDEISAPVAAAALRGHGVYTSKDITPIDLAAACRLPWGGLIRLMND